MSEKKMKELRRRVYGDLSQRTRAYVQDEKTGALRCIGVRRGYQEAKKIERKRKEKGR